ncbi:MAG: zf-HC2 domain-containing protein [Actinomycetota bacterium]
MKAELTCAQARVELSARLDGEVDASTASALDDHLIACPACRRHERELQSVRRAVRLQPTQPVPDLTERIMASVAARPRRGESLLGRRLLDRLQAPMSPRELWSERARVAAIAAAIAAVLLVGVTAPWSNRPADIASASEIAQRIRAAARSLATYHAMFSIEERGWHPSVPERSFSAEVWFEAPEKLRLHVRDLTPYPGRRWPANDVEMVAKSNKWWIREPTTCPTAALPACAVEPRVEQRTVVTRQPFDGASSLPTDIIVPLESIAGADGLEVLGAGNIAGREAHRVGLSYGEASPLVAALQQGGSWRPFHPLDRVQVWIDQGTWFPLRFDVRAGSSPERDMWAERNGVAAERPGELLLSVEATALQEEERIPPGTFAPRTGGTIRSGSFTQRAFEMVARRGAPSFTAGLEPYRAGVTDEGRRLLTYARGMTWLKVTFAPPGGLANAYESSSELVELPNAASAFYEPATGTIARRVDIYSRSVHLQLESNLSRSDLLEVADSAGVAGSSPETLTEQGVAIRRVTPKEGYGSSLVRRPSYLPDGYGAEAMLLSSSARGNKLVAYYRRSLTEYEASTIRITNDASVSELPPSSEEFVNVRLNGTLARWSFERSELEWIDGRIYRAVAVPGWDIDTAIRIAGSLR